MVYVGLLIPLGQRLFVAPVIVPGEVIVEDKAKVLAALEPQVLFAITLKFPETKLFEILRVIEVVP